jgi:Tfp pilus assembly protein PilF
MTTAPDTPSAAVAQAIANNNAGFVLARQGDWAGALVLYEQALGPLRQAGPAQHRNLAALLNNQGAALATTGKLDAATRAFQEAFALRLKELGQEDPFTWLSLHNLAWVTAQLKQRDQACAYAEVALRHRTRLLGSQHPDTLLTAGLYRSLQCKVVPESNR